MFGLLVPILNPNLLKKKKNIYIYIYVYIYLKLIISKILSITFIIITLLLNHINIAFQSTSIQLNLSKSLSKP